jgi:hypothetical protein
LHELRTLVFVVLLAGVAVAGIACGSNTAAPVGDPSDAATTHISLKIEGMT